LKKPDTDCKKHPDAWHRSVPNCLPDVVAAASDVAEQLRQHGVSATAAHAVHFAIEEILTNTVRYSRAAQPTQIAIALRNDAVVVEIEDDGQPFDPLQLPTPQLSANLDDRQAGGIGIHLVRKMVSSLAYERRHNRNHITITVAR
jgi:anti-sigma regulatory factor (Ser/Thr protein kinase)